MRRLQALPPAIRGSMEQGLLTKPLRLEDIYHRTTLSI